jgi:hypothetical protein
MRDDVASGLTIIDAILSRGDLQNYYLAHSACGEFLRRLRNVGQAKLAFERALSLTQQEAEQRFLRRKLSEIDRFRQLHCQSLKQAFCIIPAQAEIHTGTLDSRPVIDT